MAANGPRRRMGEGAPRTAGARAAVARTQRTALIFILSLFAGSWLIVGALLAPVAGGWWAIGAAALLFTVAPLAVFLRSRGGDHYPGALVRLLIFRPMWYAQLLLLVGAMAGGAAAIAGLPFGAARVAGRAVMAAVATAFALLSIAGYVGSRRLVVTRLTTTLPSLPPGLEGLRLVLICDTHIGPHTSLAFLARIASAVRHAKPDLIVVAGDLIDDYAPDVKHYAAAFDDLSAPLGVYLVVGNHEVYAGWSETRPRLEALESTLLVNEVRIVMHHGTPLAIVGTGDPAAGWRTTPDVPAPDLDAALEKVPAGTFTIAIAHNPSLWPPLAARGVPLTLSGHTHWGQLALIRTGWSVASLFLEHAMGGYRRGDTLLYVHPGTNYWGVPFRIGVRSEVAVLTLVSGSAARLTGAQSTDRRERGRAG